MMCWIYRWLVACHVDAQTTPGSRLNKHLHACTACRAYYQTHLRVSGLLATQAPEIPFEGAGSFKDSILKSLPASHSAPRSAYALGSRSVLAMAASVLIVVSLTLAGLRLVAQRKARMREQTAVLASMTTLPEDLAPIRLIATYGPLVQAPLETEIRNLSMDAKNTARFLVQCTPFAKADKPAIK